MDPITAATAIITAACAVAGAIKTAQQIYIGHKQKKAGRLGDADLVGPESSTPVSAFEFSQRINNLVAKFGRRFGHKLDEQVKRQVFRLQPQLKALISELDTLKRDSVSGQSAVDFEKRRAALLGQANQLKEEIERALIQFTGRVEFPLEPQESQEPTGRPVRQSLKFFYGALLCQAGEADSGKLSVRGMADSPKRWGFVCAYCFLEVGDYSAVRFSHRGEPVVYSDMLAASHVMACPSFQDRRAYYKCLACYENHQDLDFPSASAFEKHMQTHPGYSFVKNESEVSEATRNKIEYYVLKPELEELMAAAADDGADGYSDEPVLRVATHAVDISPISSPELSTRQSTAKPAGVAARGLSLPVDAIHAIRTPVPVRAVGAELPTNPYSGRSVPSEMQADQDGPAEMSADNFPGMPSFYGSPTNFATQPAAAYDGRPEPETLWPRVAAGQGTAPEDANLSRSPVPLAVRPSDVERTPSRGSTTSLSAQAQAAMPRTATQPVAHTQEKLQQGQRLSSMNSRPGYSTQNSLGNKEASGKKGFRDRLFNN